MVSEAVPDKVFKDIPLFHNLNSTERHQLADVVQSLEFKPGDVILRQGEECRNLWILVEGQCEVVRHVRQSDAVQESIVLATLEPYNQFGEMSFFHAAPHSADVRAKTRVRLLKLARADYQDLIDEGVTAAYKLAQTAVESMAQRLRRMDEWIAELLCHQPSAENHQREWTTFREKLFGRWNL